MTRTLGARLKAAIEREKLSPAEVARRAKTTEATIHNWLNDLVNPEHVKAFRLFNIADAVGLNARELLIGDAALRVSEPGAVYESHSVKSEILTIAIQLVVEELDRRNLALPPTRKAAAIKLAYDLLDEGIPQAKVLRFVLPNAA